MRWNYKLSQLFLIQIEIIFYIFVIDTDVFLSNL